MTGLAAACLLALLVVTLTDAIGRYFFAAPIEGASEIVGFLLGYTIFLAMPVITRRHGHIKVGVLGEKLPAAWQPVERILVWAGTIGGFGLVTWLLFDQARRMLRNGDLMTYLDFARAPFVYPIVFLAAITALVLVVASPFRDGGDGRGE